MRCKRFLSILLVILIIIASTFNGMFLRKVYAEEVWINISDVAGLNNIRNNLNGNYRLTCDIDLTGGNFVPIGSSSAPFTGVLDGNSKSIRNISINDTSTANKGLFSVIGAIGEVKNLCLEEANVIGGDYTGILSGINNGIIQKCYTKGNVTGKDYAGGLVGSNSGQVRNSFSSAFVSGKDYTGGLIGSNSGTVDRSYSSSNVEASVFNNYLKFDGIDDYILIPHNANYATDKFTLEAWFQWDNVGTNDVQFIVGKGLNEFEIHTGGPSINNIRFIPTAPTSQSDTWLDVKSAVQAGWFHVAAVYDFDYANSYAKVYINGVQQDLWKNGTTFLGKTAPIIRYTNSLLANTNSFNIGRRWDGSYKFKGKISDVRFWNIARTSEQINADKNKKLNGNESGLIGYWKLDEQSGTEATDSSTTHNNGTLMCGVTRLTEATANNKGGLIGSNTGSVSNSYYDSTVSEQNDTTKGDLKTTTQMKVENTFDTGDVNTTWDFNSIWGINSGINDGYPYLLAASTAPAEDKITVTNNNAGADTILVSNLLEGDVVKVYDSLTDGTLLGTSPAVGSGQTSATVTIAQLGAGSGNVYVTVTSTWKAESTPRTVKAYIAESLSASTAPLASAIKVINNINGTNDTIAVANVPLGATIKVYDAATGGSQIGTSLISTGSGPQSISVSQLGSGNGSVYVTITETGKAESTPRTEQTYIAEPLPATVILAAGSLGIAGNGTITGLDSTKTYNVKIVGGSDDGKYVSGTGSIGTTTAVSITGVTSITGLTNGTTYKVIDVTQTVPPTVLLTSDSQGTAGDSKVTGLTSGLKYQVGIGGTLKYVKENGILSTSKLDLGDLIGTDIIGLTNGIIYNVQEYTTSAAVTVVLEEGSLGTEGDECIIGLTAGNKYKVIVNGVTEYVKADGTLSTSESEVGKLSGTEITGLTNGTTYKVEKYTSAPITYTLAYTAGLNGTITGTLSQIVNSGSNGSTITAVPNAGYHFLSWSDGLTSATRADINVNANISVSATFAANQSSGGSSNSSGSSSGTTQITVPVTDGNSSNIISQTEIQRTMEADGTKKDNINYTENKAKETVDALKKQGKDVARIVVPDTKDEVSEAKINIPMATISVLSKGNINLEIDTENARISLPKESIQDLSQNGIGQINGDLYFRLVPIKDEKQQEEIKARVNQETVIKEVAGNNGIQVLGRPMTIETNMSQRAVDITLPLKGVIIPSNLADREAFLKDLGVFIEHSDGEKVLARGEIVEYAPGVLGIKFRINKFSNFTIVKLNQEGWKNSLEGWRYIKNGQSVTGWNRVNNRWYLMDSTGIMEIGWKQTNGSWYFLNNDGAMGTGWQLINNNWYLLNDSGAMETGWVQSNGVWYYLNCDGDMASNATIDGYTLDESGVIV